MRSVRLVNAYETTDPEALSPEVVGQDCDNNATSLGAALIPNSPEPLRACASSTAALMRIAQPAGTEENKPAKVDAVSAS